MAHGHPDYGRSGPLSTVHRVDDMGELAARLGSIDAFDRRGNVVWLDDFEASVLHWVTYLAGTGATAALSTVQVARGNQSCKLTGGSNGAALAAIYRYIAYPRLSRMGFEVSWISDLLIDRLDQEIQIFTGALNLRGSIRLDPSGQTLAYLNAAGTYTTFATGVKPGGSQTCANPAKLVIDATTQKYVRYILAETEYSLSGIALNSTASAVSPTMDVYVELKSRAGNNDVAYVDDAIVTQNEP